MVTSLLIIYFIGVFVFMTAYGLIDYQESDQKRYPAINELFDYLLAGCMWPMSIAICVIYKVSEGSSK